MAHEISQEVISKLEGQSTKTLRAIWSRTVKYQDEKACPAKKVYMVNGLAVYYADWRDNDLEILAEDIVDAQEFGVDNMTVREVRKHNSQE